MKGLCHHYCNDNQDGNGITQTLQRLISMQFSSLSILFQINKQCRDSSDHSLLIVLLQADVWLTCTSYLTMGNVIQLLCKCLAEFTPTHRHTRRSFYLPGCSLDTHRLWPSAYSLPLGYRSRQVNGKHWCGRCKHCIMRNPFCHPLMTSINSTTFVVLSLPT